MVPQSHLSIQREGSTEYTKKSEVIFVELMGPCSIDLGEIGNIQTRHGFGYLAHRNVLWFCLRPLNLWLDLLFTCDVRNINFTSRTLKGNF